MGLNCRTQQNSVVSCCNVVQRGSTLDGGCGPCNAWAERKTSVARLRALQTGQAKLHHDRAALPCCQRR